MNIKLLTKNLAVLAALIIFLGICAGPIANGFGVAFSPTVEQEFITNSQNAPGTFTYKIDEVDENARGTYATFTITGSDSAEIEPLQFNGPGYYEFEVYQVVTDPKPGYVYDDEVYTITARVNNALVPEIVIRNKHGNKCHKVTFTNRYDLQPTDPKLMVDPPVRKTVTGEPAQPGVFTFKLMARVSSQPMPAGSSNGVKTVQITGNGEAEFGTWSYYEPGTYYYTVSEVNSGGAGYTYDAAVYTITDTVTEDNGSLVLNRVVTNNVNRPVASLSYINKYSWDAGPPPGPTPTSTTNPQNPQNPANPQNPTNPTGPYNPGSGPKTGDDANTTLYIALLCLGSAAVGAALMFLIFCRNCKKNPKKERCDRHE